MASPAVSNTYLGEKPPQQSSRSRSRSRQRARKQQEKKVVLGYASEGVTDHDIFNLPGSDWQLLGFLTLLAAIVRLFRIYQPSSVVFDEVHFGGFASKYIKGKFFMDVHPPLAKLLITLAGWLAGFDGNFDFKDIGKDYLEPGVPYVAMRLLPALLGVATIPTMFLTLKAYGCRTMTAALGAGLIIFENALVTQSRLILLDSPLVIFTALTALAWVSFTNQHEQGPAKAFGPSWWFWLALSGLGLGATVSVKWVGLFTIAWVGSLTLVQLWCLVGDPKNVTPRLWWKHFFARFFCLVVIPVTFYMGMFGIHFLCLVNPGDGDGFMSSEFQATLNSKGMKDVPADVAFGSRVSIRHHNTQGGYLHSHAHMYLTGSKQQQITLYPHKDENNIWLLENQTLPDALDNSTKLTGPTAWDNMGPIYIEDGAIIRLYHVTTNRRLHSHDVRAPVTEADWQNEVSAYGYEGFEGDANDLFRVEIIKSMSEGAAAKKRLRTIQTKFKLVHIMTGCVLFSHKVKLPDWAFEQQEVTCARGATLPNAIWYVEGNIHPLMTADDAKVEKVNYRNPGFLGKFWELQQVMWKTNAGLVESHAWDSRPPSWPILRRGINFWGKHHRQIYLIGNPLIWWSSTATIALYVLIKGLAVLRWQRGYKDYANTTFKRFDYEVGTTILGWAFHYFPFYLMARQLFLHHYLPALYFAVMGLSQVYDFIFYRFDGSIAGVVPLRLRKYPAIGQATAVAFLAASITIFTIYSPLAYGNAWTKGTCNSVKLFKTWDWDCNNFLNSYADYATVLNSDIPSIAAAPSSSGPVIPQIPKQNQAQQPQAPQQQQQQPIQAQPEQPKDAQISPKQEVPPVQPAVEGLPILSREEKIEYRDQNGRILNDEEVKALQGKVSFKTRYETRTRVVDAQGNEIENELVDFEDEEAPESQAEIEIETSESESEGERLGENVEEKEALKEDIEGKPEGEGAGIAPPHPDVEGSNPETADAESEIEQASEPASVRVEGDVVKEKSAEGKEREARPVGEGLEPTEEESA